MERKCVISLTISLFISFFLLVFNFYYFFIKRNVGPSFYFEKFVGKSPDKIIDAFSYISLTDEYFILNKNYNDQYVHVFIGDSITKSFNLCEFTQNKKFEILNRGIFSDTTYGLYSRIDKNINNLNVDKLFLMIGYNDLFLRNDSEIYNNIIDITKAVSCNQLIIQSILPVEKKYTNQNLRISTINKQLNEFAMQEGHLYIDLHTHFLDAERKGIDKKLTHDGIHPNYDGYKLWYDLIRHHLISD